MFNGDGDGGNAAADRDKLLKRLAREREERAEQREKEARLVVQAAAAIVAQRAIRRYFAKEQTKDMLRAELDTVVLAEPLQSPLPQPLEQLAMMEKLLFVFDESTDSRRTLGLCKVMLTGLQARETNIMTLAASARAAKWLATLKRFLTICARLLGSLEGSVKDKDPMSTLLHTILVITDHKCWNLQADAAIAKAHEVLALNLLSHLAASDFFNHMKKMLTAALCRPTLHVSYVSLSAAVSLAFRPLLLQQFKQETFFAFITSILTVPTLVTVLGHCQEILDVFARERLAERCMLLLGNSPQLLKIAFNSMEGNDTLCFMGNMVELVIKHKHKVHFDVFVQVLLQLLQFCQSYVAKCERNISTDHPILGWFSGHTSAEMLAALHGVLTQIRLLWTPASVTNIFADLMSASMAPSGSMVKLPDLVAMNIRNNCMLFLALKNTVRNAREEIVGVLAFTTGLVPRLWQFMDTLGPKQKMEVFLVAAQGNIDAEPYLPVLWLALEATRCLMMVLDEHEIYDKKEPLSLSLLAFIAQFLNNFTFRMLWRVPVPSEETKRDEILKSCRSLLNTIRDMHDRRSIMDDKLWFLTDMPAAKLERELESEREARARGQPVTYARAQVLLESMPHLLPHKTRARLFRAEVQQDKAALSALSGRLKPLIRIRRGHALTDGFHELRKLDPMLIKDVIKIKYVNAQGLDEAGIDENGVFKEFLEETIKGAFHPDFGLFRASADNKLYPSPASCVHDEHLDLFHFVGTMLGKAAYDGIVVEVPFAHFFLNTILGRRNAIDELSSYDAELSKNLQFIKTYDGDVSDLDLVFSADDDILGKHVSVPLQPGGSSIPVTNENRILYVHLMADFRLNRQLKPQCDAFVRGFRSVISGNWLRYFSASELQRLISGDNVALDVRDLRNHVQYEGGLSSSHPVIRWLWDVVEKDLDAAQQSLFLKFVTSCSKPPLLGFSTLHPPFTIRAVRESESEEQYTVGSLIRTFFSRGQDTDRLPTASTCFNLLKLPLYKSKSVLRQKLLYAISSNAGFELS
eukprot:m.201104 g.201104  ORF g.201104 m.201104 type:complete len:1033 (+) comp17703_c1_seq2:77-3175(+)